MELLYVAPTVKPDRLKSFSRLVEFPCNPSTVLASLHELLNLATQWRVIVLTVITEQEYCPQQLDRKKHFDDLTLDILGDMIMGGEAARVGRDIYLGAVDEKRMVKVFRNMTENMQEYYNNTLLLPAPKTIDCPDSIRIQFWEWKRGGSVTVSPGKIEPLANAPEPLAVRELRFWLGSYKQICRCIRNYASLLVNIQSACIGKSFVEQIEWTNELRTDFQAARDALRTSPTITVPNPHDQLKIITHGRVRKVGSDQYTGAVLYFKRGGSIKIGGYFSAKLNKNQLDWPLCEKEALSIRLACDHFERELNVNVNTTRVLTDSKGCARAFNMLRSGCDITQCCHMAGVMSVMLRHKVNVVHLKNTKNPGYFPRTPIDCTVATCLCVGKMIFAGDETFY